MMWDIDLNLTPINILAAMMSDPQYDEELCEFTTAGLDKEDVLSLIDKMDEEKSHLILTAVHDRARKHYKLEWHTYFRDQFDAFALLDDQGELREGVVYPSVKVFLQFISEEKL